MKKNGFSLLLIVIIIGASLLLVAIGFSVSGIGTLENQVLLNDYAAARYAGDSCIQVGLESLRKGEQINTLTLNINDASCILTIDAVGQQFFLQSTSTRADVLVNHDVAAVVSAGSVTITQWESL